jgi:hypothetical protein
MKIKTLSLAKSKSKKPVPSTMPYSVTASDIHAKGLMLAYGVGYDWSRGCEDVNCLPTELFIHVFIEEEVKRRPHKQN